MISLTQRAHRTISSYVLALTIKLCTSHWASQVPGIALLCIKMSLGFDMMTDNIMTNKDSLKRQTMVWFIMTQTLFACAQQTKSPYLFPLTKPYRTHCTTSDRSAQWLSQLLIPTTRFKMKARLRLFQKNLQNPTIIHMTDTWLIMRLSQDNWYIQSICLSCNVLGANRGPTDNQSMNSEI